MEAEIIKLEQEQDIEGQDLETLLFSEDYDETPTDPAAWISSVAKQLPSDPETGREPIAECQDEKEEESSEQSDGLPLLEEGADPFEDRIGIDYDPEMSQTEREKRTFIATIYQERTQEQRQRLPIGSLHESEPDRSLCSSMILSPLEQESVLQEKLEVVPQSYMSRENSRSPMPFSLPPSPVNLMEIGDNRMTAPDQVCRALCLPAEGIGPDGMVMGNSPASGVMSMQTQKPEERTELQPTSAGTNCCDAPQPVETRRRENDTLRGDDTATRRNSCQEPGMMAGAAKSPIYAPFKQDANDKIKSPMDTVPKREGQDRMKNCLNSLSEGKNRSATIDLVDHARNRAIAGFSVLEERKRQKTPASQTKNGPWKSKTGNVFLQSPSKKRKPKDVMTLTEKIQKSQKHDGMSLDSKSRPSRNGQMPMSLSNSNHKER